MCGVFGWIGTFTYPERRGLAWALGHMNDRRGGHSWGFVGSHSGSWVRRVGMGDIEPHGKKLARHRHVMAHTRLATFGSISARNCHPFELDDVFLSHNGQVWNADEFVDQEQFEVDSELLLHRIAAGRDVDDLQGYGTVTWVEQFSTGEILICNVGSGDLAVASVLDGFGAKRGTVYSSSEQHLTLALEANDLPYRLYKLEEHQVYLARADGLYRSEETLKWGEYNYQGFGRQAAWLYDSDIGWYGNTGEGCS